MASSPRPTAAQTRALIGAIFTGQPIQEGTLTPRVYANLLRCGWIEDGIPTQAAYDALDIRRVPVSEQVHRLNRPMLARLRKCAADTSPNWDGQITIYPPEARELVLLIDAALGEQG